MERNAYQMTGIREAKKERPFAFGPYDYAISGVIFVALPVVAYYAIKLLEK